MPSLRRTVRARSCVAASKAASAAKASSSPTKTKAFKRRTWGVGPKGSASEAAKGSSGRKDQGGPSAKAASEIAKGSSSQKDHGEAKAKAASTEAKGSSTKKDQGNAKAKAASEKAKGSEAANEKAAMVKDKGGAEAKAANEVPRGSSRGGAKAANEEAARAEDQAGAKAKAAKDVDQGGAVTRSRRSARSSGGASTSMARSVSPSSSDDDCVDDPDYVEIKRPRLLSLHALPDLKETPGTKSCDTKNAPEPAKRGRGRPRKVERSCGPRRQSTEDGAGADVGSRNTASTSVQQEQVSPMPMALGPPRKYVKVDDSFDPPRALRQPVIKRAGTSYKCSVSQCPLSKRECSVGLWLFALPCETTDSKMRTAWETSIEIDPTVNRPLSPRVCYRHFAKSDFVMRKQRLMGLEEDAVPSIQIPVETKRQRNRITHVSDTSSQSAQSAASGSTAAKAGENPAASADSTANTASGPTASSSQSHVPQPEASTRPESASTVSRTRERSRNRSTSPEPKSDPAVTASSVLNPEAASASNVGSAPASAKPLTKSSTATVRETRKSTVVAGEVPPVLPEAASDSDVGFVPASTKGSRNTKPESSTATASERGNSTVAAGETPPSTESVPPEAVSVSSVASVPASTKGSPSTKPQPGSSAPTASERGDRPVVAGQTLSSTEVVPPDAASDCDDASVPASTKGSPSTKAQPEESSVATASETEDSTGVADRTPPSPEIVPQTSSSALESAPTGDSDTDSATEDCFTSSAQDDPALDIGFEAAVKPTPLPVQSSSPVLVSESTAATVSSAPAAGDATLSAADVIVVPVEQAVSELTVEYTCDFVPDSTATGNSSTMAESAEPPVADEVTTATGTSAKHETAPTEGASAALPSSRENSPELVEDPKSALCAGSVGGDSSAPKGQPPSEADASASPEKNDCNVLLLPEVAPVPESASSASDAMESSEDCSGPQPQFSHSTCKRAKLRHHQTSKQAANEQAANFGVSPPSSVAAASSRQQQSVSTVGARLLPGAVNSSKVVIKSEPGTVKSEPDADASCSTATDTTGASTLEYLERNPSPATTLSYSSDTDEERSDKPEVFSGRLFDPSQGRYVVEKEIIGERDDFGMSAVYYRVSWAPK